MKYENLNHLAIDLPGLSPDIRPQAKADIIMLVRALASASTDLGSSYLLERVLITDHFEREVNRLLQDRSGISGYVAARDQAHAIGKTLWVRTKNGNIGFVVIIDSNSIGPWSLNNSRCLTTVLHELTHVIYEERHLRRLGEQEFTAVNDTRERWLDAWATRLLDEFDVDRMVDIIICAIAKRDDGAPWSLRELDEAEGIDWEKAILDGLHQMPEVVDDHVWRFRTWHIDIQALASALIPYVNDILIVITHAAARYVGTEKWTRILTTIQATEAGQRYLNEHLDTILGQLGNGDTPFDSAAQVVGDATEGIFRNCGLTFETVEDGVYIAVGAPSR